MSPAERLQYLRSKPGPERQVILRGPAEGCPIQPWPFGMPSSASPYVVLLGVSPGNRPKAEDREFKTDGQACGELPTFGSPHSGFYYDDPGRYWQKARDLAQFLVRRDEPRLSEKDAVALSSHLNLGTGQYGQAGAHAIEDDILVWVSHLLHSRFDAKLLVCFGLRGIFAMNRYSTLWNSGDGLPVDWTRPLAVRRFDGRYAFRLWTTQRADEKRMAVLMWPNHPSRHPFSGGPESKNWQSAKHEADRLLQEHGF